MPTANREQMPVAPFFVGPKNAEHVMGQPWRWCKETARRLGVPVLTVGAKPMIRASELAAALEREAARLPPPREPTEEEEKAAIRARVGLTLRSG